MESLAIIMQSNGMKKNTVKKLCSDLVADFLVDKKITHVFDLSGGMITYLEDAISRKRGIECVPMHHEQAAGFAAEGYARKSQNFGVAMATSGPGATNLITAIGSSYFDSIPTMFIVGQVHSDSIKKNNKARQEGFQETDIVSVVRPLTKYAVLVRDPNLLIYELEKACFIMKSGRFGSVLIDIPINIQRTEVEIGVVKHFLGSKEHKSMQKNSDLYLKKVEDKKINKLQDLLKKSKAPLVIIGNGVRLSGATSELFNFVKRNNLPVVASLMGIDSYPYGPNFVGFIGSNGNRDANIVFANADLIIALGTRLDIRQTGDPKFFNQKAILVHVDIDSNSINYSIKSKLFFATNLSTFFDAVKKIKTSVKPRWVNFVRSVQGQFARPLLYRQKKVDPNTLLHEISDATSGNSIIVADVGQNQMWCAQSWRIKKGQRLLFSGGMGAMGFSLPAAIGAWIASPKSDLIVICGDGGIQISIQEMETVARNGIPMKLFIFNNKSLGMVREFQDLYFNKRYQSTVVGYGCPELSKIAHAYNFEYARIDSVNPRDPILKEILMSKKPILIEVDLDIETPLQPKVVYGHALDDQSPYLDGTQKALLEKLKTELYSA